MTKKNLACFSQYVHLHCGVKLAVSVWMPTEAKDKPEPRPAVITFTRYWRALAFAPDTPEAQPFYLQAATLWALGYVLVTVDVRGTGASFGARTAELSPPEVEDASEVIDWVSQQPWCDGRVATTGVSYTANTTMHSLATSSTALKLGVCRAPDLDVYRHLLAPGGVINSWFVRVWGDSTAAQDMNDVQTLRQLGRWQDTVGGKENVLGVRPVDDDIDHHQLSHAVKQHQANFNLGKALDQLDSVDLGGAIHSSPCAFQTEIEKNGSPLVIRCGWHDATTALGALSMFCSFSNPIRVILGPWSHHGDVWIDPFLPGDGTCIKKIPIGQTFDLLTESLDRVFKPNHDGNDQAADKKEPYFCVVEYFTLGENRWKTTTTWPLPQASMQRWYLSADHQLRQEKPQKSEGSDPYQVDPGTSTGLNNRWGCQMKEPVYFCDRREADKRLLVYDTPPLTEDTEITGHPIVSLFVRSSATDGQFFAYLETIDPDGRVRLLTDGQLRGIHRKISSEKPPFKMFGPYHSLETTRCRAAGSRRSGGDQF